jgi:hypothetical protein
LPTNATFCRHCGASDECGWGEEDDPDDLDLPGGYREDDEDDFDYDEFVAREFPDQAPEGAYPQNRHFQMAVIVLVCIGLLASAIFYVCH